jgi:N-acetylglutamate synthase-like GNAT family acetyltransferase
MTDMNETIVVTDAPEADDVAVISQGLDAYNEEQGGINDRKLLAVLVKDADGKTVGGISGRSSRGLLLLEFVYLPKILRGGGMGSRLLAMAEEQGRKHGCKHAFLVTFSFQAPGFYKKHGWRVFGETPCDPPGTTQFIMTKEL